MKKYLFPLVLLFALPFLLAQKIKVSSLVQQRVREKITRYTHNHERQCREEALKKASRLADSLMLEYARSKLDTASLPALPPKPAKPNLLKPKDTTELKPLF